MRPILLMEIKKAYKNKLFLLSMLTASLIALYAAVFSIISYQELICKGWFLPSNTYDCGSFVVN